jgi:hypothetical protein
MEPILVKLPNGASLKFPGDMPKEEIQRRVDLALGKSRSENAPEGVTNERESLLTTAKKDLAGTLENVGAFASGVSDTLTFGLPNPLDFILGQIAPEMAQKYITEPKAKVEESTQKLQADNPYATMAGKAAGFMVPAVPVEAAMLRGLGEVTTRGGRAMANYGVPATIGGLFSGLQSAGEDMGQGNVPNLADVASDTTFGAGAGVLGSTVAQAAPSIFKYLKNTFTGAKPKIASAEQLINTGGQYAGNPARTIDPATGKVTGGFDEAALRAEAQTLRQDEMLPDLNDSLRNEVMAAASNPRVDSAVAGAFAQKLTERAKNFIPMIKNEVKAILPDYKSTSIHKAGMEARLKPLQEEYDALIDSVPVATTTARMISVVRGILPKESATATNEAGRKLVATIKRMGRGEGKDKVISARDLLELKKEADDIYASLADVTNPGSATISASRKALEAKQAIDDILKSEVDGLDVVAKDYADVLTFNTMRTRGQKAATRKTGSIEDLTEYTRTLKPAELDAFKEGYRDALQVAIERGEVSFLRKVDRGSTAELDRIGALFGDDVVDGLKGLAEKAFAMQETTAAGLASVGSAQRSGGSSSEFAKQAADWLDIASGIGRGSSLLSATGASARRTSGGFGAAAEARAQTETLRRATAQGPAEVDAAIAEIFDYLNRKNPVSAGTRGAAGIAYTGSQQ